MKKSVLQIIGFVLACLLLLFPVASFAQSIASPERTEQFNYSIIPPSPTAAALARFTEVPVSLYTGTPSISIPLYTIKSGEITLPISLDYHAGGIRVDDYSSWVGLGWSVSAGGVVSRSQRGLPDETPNRGFLAIGTQLPSPENVDPRVNHDLLEALATGIQDGEPDQFSYAVPGEGGKFYLTPDQGTVTIPYKPVSIKSKLNNTSSDDFELKSADGTTYTFGGTEARESTKVNVNGPERSYISSWYLNKITSAGKKDEVTFRYEDHGTIGFNTYDVYTLRFRQENQPIVTKSKAATFVEHLNAKKLERIFFENGKVEFLSSFGREDILSDKKLDAVVIYARNHADNTYKELKRFVFNYSYFGTTHKRLKLLSVREVSGETLIPPYTFEYNELNVPVHSFAQDHWGYYNGQPNANLIPKTAYADKMLGDADRTPNPLVVRSGLLNKMHYPTGGWAEFAYEPNSYKGIVTTTTYPTHNVSVAGVGLDDFREKETPAFSAPRAVSAKLTFRAERSESTSFHHNRGYGELREGGRTIKYLYGPFEEDMIYTTTVDVDLYPDKSYTLWVEAQGEIVTASLKLTYPVHTNQTQSVTAGGVRIGEITYYNEDNTIAKIKKYDYNEPGTAYSSGSLVTDPNYTNTGLVRVYNGGGSTPDSPPIGCAFLEYEELTIASNSNNSLAANSVCYPYVTEYDISTTDGQRNGKTEYRFSPYRQSGTPFPFPASADNSWRGGLLKEKKVFGLDPKENKYYLIEELINHYQVRADVNHTLIKGLKVGHKTQYNGQFCENDAYFKDRFAYEPFSDYAYWQYMDSSLVTYYDRYGMVTSNLTTYHYDNPVHAQLTRTEITTSTNQRLTTEYTYPLDYPAAGVHAQMQNAHMVSPVIEQKKYELRNGDKLLLSAQKTNYAAFDSKVLPQSVHVLESASPLRFNTPQEETQFLTGPQGYRQKVQLGYDGNGNMRQSEKASDVPSVYLWGYHNTLPIAEIRNCTYERVLEKLPEVNLTEESLHLLSDATVIREKMKLLQEKLANAMVTTLTHDPLKGITSQTGPDGVTLTYKYDDLGRLVWVKDHLGNLVKHYEYHYKQ